MKIRTSILVTSSIALAGVLVAAMVFFVQQRIIRTYEEYMPYTVLGDEVEGLITKSHLHLEEHLSGTMAVDLQKDVFAGFSQADKLLNQAKNAEDSELGKFHGLEDKKVDQLINQSISAINRLKSLAEKRVSNKKTTVKSAFNETYDLLEIDLESLIAHVQEKTENDVADLKLLSLICIAAILLVVSLLGVLTYKVQNRIEVAREMNELKLQNENERINNLTNFVESIASGDFSTALEVSDDDSFASTLVKMKDQLYAGKQEDEKRNWINSGLAKFSELLRNRDNLEEVANDIVSNLVRYLKANQGALFVVEEEESDQYMELKASYAYDRKKYIKRKIYRKEGLVGQCWLEGDKILLKDVPQDYMNITSGVGDAVPSEVIIVPLKINEEIYGVIELASFSEFENYQIDFLEKVGENIAGTLSAAKNSETTRALLQSSREQSEMLKSHEEDLRHHVEELKATQEEMERVSGEMSEQIKAVNTTLGIVEFDLKGVIRDANEKFINLVGYTKEELVGNHHRMLVSYEDSTSDSYASFWSKLSKGEAFTGEFKRISKKGKEIWIKGIYSPVLNTNGEPIRVVKYAYDITKEKNQGKYMAKIANEMSEQLRVINATMATVEFTMDGTIQGANQNFLDLMGYEKSELLGKHHSMLVEAKERDGEDYKAFWSRLAAGESFNGEFKRIRRGGSQVWIKGMYSPILNNEGVPVKVLKVAYDITLEKTQERIMKEQLQQLRDSRALSSSGVN
ncbi:PAS domain S-box protein [Fulvivirga sediminis]|uniref:PAS domain S-box protein n=1 Tax=Fulvivirga sediminis TaxID=2803949 RepID=A0A937K2U3_9BACT|nr:PAS domain S-box protein [Fulvivirga sediminis]MBL3658212.1 PAS domain S-box protein [Fulvivirga sediminis]